MKTKIRTTLEFIEANPQGLTFTQIHKFRFLLSRPDESYEAMSKPFTDWRGKVVREKLNRGRFISGLVDQGGGFKPGILTRYCRKVGKLYFRNEVPYSGR